MSNAAQTVFFGHLLSRPRLGKSPWRILSVGFDRGDEGGLPALGATHVPDWHLGDQISNNHKHKGKPAHTGFPVSHFIEVNVLSTRLLK